MSNEAGEPDQPEAGGPTPQEADGDAEPRRRSKLLGRGGEDEESLSERLTQQFASQWALLRAERRSNPSPIESGPSNFNRAGVPWALDLAAAWAWRFLLIAGATLVVLWLLAYFAVVTLPLAISMLLAALAAPVVRGMAKIGIPPGLGAGLVVLFGIASLGALLTFVGREVIKGGKQLADQVVDGIDKIRNWLRDGPLNASDSQINGWLANMQKSITERTQDSEVITQVSEVGSAVGHVLAGCSSCCSRRTSSWQTDPASGPGQCACSPGRPRAGRLVRPGCLGVVDPVRAGNGDRGPGRCHRHHDRRGRAQGAAGAADRGAGLPRRLRAVDRCHRCRVGGGARRARCARSLHGPAHARWGDPGPADRGTRPPAVPDGPVRLRSPVGGHRRARLRGPRRRCRRCPDCGAVGGSGQLRHTTPGQLHQGGDDPEEHLDEELVAAGREPGASMNAEDLADGGDRG